MGSHAGAESTSGTLVLDRALEAIGTTRDRMQPDPFRFASASAAEQSPMLRALLLDPLSGPYRVGMAENRIRERLDSPSRTYLNAVGLGGVELSRGYFGNPLRTLDARLLAAADPLAEACAMLEQASSPFDYEDKLPGAAELPNPARHEVARVVAAIANARHFLRRALEKLPPGIKPDSLFDQAVRGNFFQFGEPDYRQYIRDIELEALHAGMIDLVMAVEDFDDFARDAQFPAIDWRMTTPLGEIVLDGRGADSVHSGEDILLILDLGGDDRYFPDDPRAARMGISVLYDRGGNDWWWSEPGKGSSAFLGYGLCWDAAGNDTYAGDYCAQGSAIFGCAFQYDAGGDDTYTANAFAQGYAMGGGAALVDLGGNDTFAALSRAQASAGPRGVAMLVNTGGNDVYTLGNDPIIDRSPQSPTHNTSMGQGAATGVRADQSDGRSLPGGVAVLVDTDGDDVYTAQVFAQGVGFLEGTGLLIDGGGDDRYEAVWYAQGSGAHRAAGALIDRGGNDRYRASQYTSIAAAHDYSVAFLIDEGGDDSYEAANLAIGGANDNGVALFVDAAGNDSYTLGQRAGLGSASITKWGTVRENGNGIGLFFDLGGADTYKSRREGPADGGLWEWPRDYPDLRLPCEAGVGIDGEYANPFPTTPRTLNKGEDEKMLREALAERRKYRESIQK